MRTYGEWIETTNDNQIWFPARDIFENGVRIGREVPRETTFADMPTCRGAARMLQSMERLTHRKERMHACDDNG